MAFRDYCSELVGVIPRLPYPYAQTLINRAWSNIRDQRLWSWLVGTGDILSADNITAGSMTTAQNSITVIADAGATSALNAVVFSNPPLASPMLGQGRQIRIGVTGSGGPVYSIVTWDGAGTITIDRPYVDPTNSSIGSNQSYQCYKCYFEPPTQDFLRYLTIRNMRAGYSIRGKKLYYTQQKLNAVDSQRGGTGDAYIVSEFRANKAGAPVHEWYPHPVNGAVYNCLYQRRGVDLSNTVDLPTTLPSSLLMAKAMAHAATWAQANVSTYPELAGTNWSMFRSEMQAQYKDELIQAIKQDDEISPITPFLQGSYFDFPLGGQFLQGHDVSSLIGDFN